MTRTILAVLLLVTSQVGAMEEPDWVYDNSTGVIHATGFNVTRVDDPAYHKFYEPSKSFDFYDVNDNLGRLTWDNGTLRFEGRIDESARAFVEYINEYAPEFCEGVRRRK